MKLIFNQDQITGNGAYRSFYQDQVIINGGIDFGKENGKHFIRPSEEMPLQDVIDMVLNGVEVADMPVIIKSPVGILEEPVFEGLPFRTHLNNSVKKFKEWGEQPLMISNNENECLLLCTVNGRYLTGTEWIIFHNQASIEILDKKAVTLLMQQPDWKPEV